MNLEERIRSSARTMAAPGPSRPSELVVDDVTSRIRRRARRHWAASAGLVASVATVVAVMAWPVGDGRIETIDVVPADHSTTDVVPATNAPSDPQPTSPTTHAPTAPPTSPPDTSSQITDPATSPQTASPPSTAQVDESPPAGIVALTGYPENPGDPASYELAAYGLDGVAIGPVDAPADAALRTEHPLATGEYVDAPIDGPFGNEPCSNLAVPAIVDPEEGSRRPIPSLPEVRDIAATPDGLTLAVRHVCPDGAPWGAPGTGWEVVRLDLNDPTATPTTVLAGPSMPPAADGFARTGDVVDIIVAPDASTFAVATLLSVDQDTWTIRSLTTDSELPLPGTCAESQGSDDLELLEGARAVVGRWCRISESTADLRVDVVDLATQSVESSVSLVELEDSTHARVELDIHDRASTDPWITARWAVDGAPDASVIHSGSSRPLPPEVAANVDLAFDVNGLYYQWGD